MQGCSTGARPPVGVEFILEVDDLDAEHRRISATGWPMIEGLTSRPWGLRDFRLVDPDGYYWRVTEPYRRRLQASSAPAGGRERESVTSRA